MGSRTRSAAIITSLTAPFLALVLATPAAAAPTTTLPSWLHPGPTVQYPSSGGTWKYGFWNAKVRSYYTTIGCHGSSVKYNGDLLRSQPTASGQRSAAVTGALNFPWSDDAYYYRHC